MDFHSRLVIKAGRQVRYQPARCDQHGVPCPLFRLRVADLASPHMLSRLRVAAPRRYVEQEPRNFNARTQRIEQLVPHVSEIDTGKPKKLPHIRQIGIPNVDFHSQPGKTLSQMWTFAADWARNDEMGRSTWFRRWFLTFRRRYRRKPENREPWKTAIPATHEWGLSQPNHLRKQPTAYGNHRSPQKCGLSQPTQ